MAVEQDDFRYLFAGYLPCASQAHHMFSMFTTALVSDAGLTGEERFKAFPFKVFQQSNCRNMGVAR